MSNGELPYRVSVSGHQRQVIAEWRSRAGSDAARRATVEAVTRIIQILRLRPHGWGDPIRELRHAQLHVYRGTRAGIIVEYAVDEAHRIVYVGRLRLASWHPLYREGD